MDVQVYGRGEGEEKDLLFENLIVLRRVLEIALERRFQLHMERRGPGDSGEPGTEEKDEQRGGKEKLTAPVGEESSAADPARGGSETEQVSIARESRYSGHSLLEEGR